MKNKSIISILFFALTMGFTTTSCEDMLTADSDRNVYVSAQDTLYSYWGIMKNMQKVAERYVILGEVRGDLVAPSLFVSDSINDIANFNNPIDGSCRYLKIKDYYAIVNGCNNYLADADTTQIINGNVQKMKKEYAQVSAIRAWAYLQLVHNYGKAPFYTAPIKSLDFIDKFDPTKEGNYITADNIASLLAPSLENLVDVPYPAYDKYNTGSSKIEARLCFIPIRLILADMYLTQGNARTAAQYYYDYIKKEQAVLPLGYKASVYKMTSNGNTSYGYNVGGHSSMFDQQTYSASQEDIAVIPSAANKAMGIMTPGPSNLFGWTVSSQSSTSGKEDATESTDEDQVTTSASVSITPNSKRELNPSSQFFTVASNSNYGYFENSTSGEMKMLYYPESGDARQGYASEVMNKDGTGYTTMYLISKQSGITGNGMFGSMSYSLSYPVIYRKGVLWLRFAESINRAGFPEYAFAILKDGLCEAYLPAEPTYKLVTDTIVSETNDTSFVERMDTIYNPNAALINYIGVKERIAATKEPFMNFNDDFFNGFESTNNGTGRSIVGVHVRGAGVCNNLYDTVYTYKKMVGAKLMKRNLTLETATKQDIIEAVEELIVDELAMEAAFEGHRFSDLIRFARHKNKAGVINGTEWLADKIARRGQKVTDAYYETTPDYNLLKTKLLNTDNWYFKVPAFK